MNKFSIIETTGCTPDTLKSAFEIAKRSAYGWTRASMIQQYNLDPNGGYFEVAINNGAWNFKIRLEII